MQSKEFPDTYFNPTKRELRESGIENTHIAFDLDSVLNELGDPLGHWLADYFGVGLDEVRDTTAEGARAFHFSVEGIANEYISLLVSQYISNESGSLLATPWMVPVLTHIYRVSDEPIVIITARGKENMHVTYDWLLWHMPRGVPFTLIMVDGMQKEVVLNRLGIRCFVDDRHKTVKRLENCIDVSIRYRRPWNEGRDEPAGHFVINDLRDLIPFVNIMYGQQPMMWPGDVPYPNREGRGGVEYA